MPIYEYRCLECGKESEQIVFGDGSDVKCPVCQGKNLEKLMSATSSITGGQRSGMPGHNDTGCCGSRPGEAQGCAGPGSCCGKTF